MMKVCTYAFAVLVVTSAQAAPVTFTTESVARQTIASPLFDPNLTTPVAVPFVASGAQMFTIDPMAGTADVTSDFMGISPLGAYDLYNTLTIGSVTPNGSGGFDVDFELLFELAITGAFDPILNPLAGVIFETKEFATFSTAGASLPFSAGTVFSDPTPPDAVAVYLKTDPFNVINTLSGGAVNIGDPVGASFGRTVSVVPEPSSLVLAVACVGGVGLIGRRRRQRTRTA